MYINIYRVNFELVIIMEGSYVWLVKSNFCLVLEYILILIEILFSNYDILILILKWVYIFYIYIYGIYCMLE